MNVYCMYVCMYVYMYVYVYVSMYTYIRMYVCIHTYVCMYVYIQAVGNVDIESQKSSEEGKFEKEQAELEALRLTL